MTEQQNIEAFNNCMRTIFITRNFDTNAIAVGGSGGCGDRKDVPEYVRRAYDIVVEEG